MTIKTHMTGRDGLLASTGIAAMAAAVAMLLAPADASAQEQRGWNRSGNGAQSAGTQRGRSSDFGQYRSQGRSQTTKSESSTRSSDFGQYRMQSRSQNAQRSWKTQSAQNRPNASSGQAVSGNQGSREWRGDRGQRSGGSSKTYTNRTQPSSGDTAVVERRGDYSGQWQRNRSYRDGERNKSYRDGDRNKSYREADRSGRDYSRTYRSSGSDSWRGDRRYGDRYRGDGDHRYRDGYRGDNDRRYRDAHRHDYGKDYRRWDRDWRSNNRYDWYRYRASNRNLYRVSRYYAPYRGYSYRRIGIGFGLSSLFYSDRYWISDPWQYRLPEVYGPYRWVRYYDDVMLVNIYTGEVVDVIYDFFW